MLKKKSTWIVFETSTFSIEKSDVQNKQKMNFRIVDSYSLFSENLAMFWKKFAAKKIENESYTQIHKIKFNVNVKFNRNNTKYGMFSKSYES